MSTGVVIAVAAEGACELPEISKVICNEYAVTQDSINTAIEQLQCKEQDTRTHARMHARTHAYTRIHTRTHTISRSVNKVRFSLKCTHGHAHEDIAKFARMDPMGIHRVHMHPRPANFCFLERRRNLARPAPWPVQSWSARVVQRSAPNT